MKHFILKTIASKKAITRDGLRTILEENFPSETRFKIAYNISSLVKKRYLSVRKNGDKQWAPDDTFTMTQIGRAQLKLLELQKN